jgi:uncharacterized protein YhfF
MWRAYRAAVGDAPAVPAEPPAAWHFCDTEADADACARLVRAGRKRATAPSRWSLDARGEPLPRPGDLHVVTDWAGVAQCVIRTTRVEVVAFRDVSAAHAAAEGEGDGSLAWWRRVHWAYYQRELAGTPYTPAPDMPIVCERFEVVYPPPAPGRAPGARVRTP